MQIPVHLMALAVLGLLKPAIAADHDNSTFPHPMTLALISPQPHQTYPASKSLPIIFAFTHATAAFQDYLPSEFRFLVSDSSLDYITEGRFASANEDDEDVYPQRRRPQDILKHTYSDTFYYTTTLEGTPADDHEVSVDLDELPPGNYSMYFSWSFNRACGSMFRQDGVVSFFLDETDEKTASSTLLTEKNACAHPVGRFAVLGVGDPEELQDGYQCVDLEGDRMSESYEFPESDVECAMSLENEQMECLAALIDGRDQERACENAREAFEKTASQLDSFDIGPNYPDISPGADADGGIDDGSESGSAGTLSAAPLPQLQLLAASLGIIILAA